MLLTVVILGSCAQSSDSSSAAADSPDQAQEINDPALKLSCEETRFVTLINLYRVTLSLSNLKVGLNGVAAARWHAKDMGEKKYFDHTEPNGRSPFDRMKAFDYPGQAENIAAGYSSAANVFCAWKKSSGHDQNMRGASWTTVSIGLVTVFGSPHTNYWSSGFSSKGTLLIAEPLTLDQNCPMPSAIPICT